MIDRQPVQGAGVRPRSASKRDTKMGKLIDFCCNILLISRILSVSNIIWKMFFFQLFSFCRNYPPRMKCFAFLMPNFLPDRIWSQTCSLRIMILQHLPLRYLSLISVQGNKQINKQYDLVSGACVCVCVYVYIWSLKGAKQSR